MSVNQGVLSLGQPGGAAGHSERRCRRRPGRTAVERHGRLDRFPNRRPVWRRTWASGAAFGIDTSNGNASYDGSVIASSGGTAGVPARRENWLAKVANTLFLTAANAYSGARDHHDGTLALDNGGEGPRAAPSPSPAARCSIPPDNTADLSAQIVNSTSPMAIDTNGQSVPMPTPSPRATRAA